MSAALMGSAGAAGPFDGAYRGNQATVRTTNSADCTSLDRSDTVVVVRDGHFNRRWGEADLSVDVGPDGAFAQSVTVNDRRRLRNVTIKGKITGPALEADIGTELCSAHLSLKKS